MRKTTENEKMSDIPALARISLESLGVDVQNSKMKLVARGWNWNVNRIISTLDSTSQSEWCLRTLRLLGYRRGINLLVIHENLNDFETYIPSNQVLKTIPLGTHFRPMTISPWLDGSPLNDSDLVKDDIGKLFLKLIDQNQNMLHSSGKHADLLGFGLSTKSFINNYVQLFKNLYGEGFEFKNVLVASPESRLLGRPAICTVDFDLERGRMAQITGDAERVFARHLELKLRSHVR